MTGLSIWFGVEASWIYTEEYGVYFTALQMQENSIWLLKASRKERLCLSEWSLHQAVWCWVGKSEFRTSSTAVIPLQMPSYTPLQQVMLITVSVPSFCWLQPVNGNWFQDFKDFSCCTEFIIMAISFQSTYLQSVCLLAAVRFLISIRILFFWSSRSWTHLIWDFSPFTWIPW